MQFHEVRFPTALSFGSIGGPERRTDVVTLASGFEERNTPWANSRRRYDAGIGLRSMDDIDALIAFFEARRGQMYGFRWKDWADFKSCKPSAQVSATDQVIGTGDGVEATFVLRKGYVSGDAVYRRPVTKPVEGTVVLAVDGVALVDGVDFSIDITTGLVTFFTAPSVGVSISAGFEFDVPVRFDTDRIQTSAATFQAGDVPDVPIVELRV
ncbi:phage distal tail protein, Rcc01695 family [Marivita sp.]|uniref:phage distal tail protein, Rcc01695 family n=1 Tax=Marivita sp. TaxID=2003365 RepID=UPI003F6B3893